MHHDNQERLAVRPVTEVERAEVVSSLFCGPRNWRSAKALTVIAKKRAVDDKEVEDMLAQIGWSNISRPILDGDAEEIERELSAGMRRTFSGKTPLPA